VYTDMPESELRDYRSTQTAPADFDAFWQRTLDESRTAPGAAPLTLEPVDTGLRTIDTWDVTFPGFGGEPVRAWLRLPHGTAVTLPAVVEYVGHRGGAGPAPGDPRVAPARVAPPPRAPPGAGTPTSGWTPGARAPAGAGARHRTGDPPDRRSPAC